MKFTSNRIRAVGEAMIEMAVIGEKTYRRGFAGDTFNTAWHMAQLLGGSAQVGFVTRVGRDAVSDAFVDQITQDGLDGSCLQRDETLTMGLYMIDLDGAERSFQYWRSASAARHLADDQASLNAVLDDAGLIHLSGISLAILSGQARERLFDALTRARALGARISFDPNIRPRLWASTQEIQDCVRQFLAITDIALPSFDDETGAWGDDTPKATLARIEAAGVGEIVVKNGANAVHAICGEGSVAVETHHVAVVKDTSGAGDAFNAGYLAARMLGRSQSEAIRSGQRISAEVIGHFGARIPKGSIPTIS
ncbi:MAG: sugar kinase [Pseudomonadota bacterium]